MSTTLAGTLDKWRDSRVPGLAAVVTDSQQIIEQAAVGLRRANASDPVTLDDRFHLGSNAKAMLATAVATQVEDGRLEWNTAVGDALGGRDAEITAAYRSMTVEMLLRHHAGVPPYTDDEADDFVLPAGVDPLQLDVTSFAHFVLSRPPHLEPGTAFSYSNAGYSVVAAMLEAVVGSPWVQQVNQRVFQPLGIHGLVGAGWPAKTDPDQPWGHLIEGGVAVPHPPDHEYQLEPFLAPAGDISMSMANYGRFLQAHLAGLGGTGTLLRAESVRTLHNDGEIGLGMGWGVTRLRTLEHLGVFSTHAGSAGTFVVAAAVSHEHDRAFALALNSGFDGQIGEWLKALVRTHLEE